MKTFIRLLSFLIPVSRWRKAFRRYAYQLSRLPAPLRWHYYRSRKSTNSPHAKNIQSELEGVLRNCEFNPPGCYYMSNPAWQYAVPNAPQRILEIGSWQGSSAIVFNCLYPNAQITCVDPWDASDEMDMALNPESLFDKNTAYFADRLRKLKLYSLPALAKLIADGETFDFIYIDGNHFEDDVLVDTYLAWRVLEVGGVLVWDDYFWQLRAYQGRNPKPSIDHFVKRHRNELKVLSAYPQIMVQKTAVFARATGQ